MIREGIVEYFNAPSLKLQDTNSHSSFKAIWRHKFFPEEDCRLRGHSCLIKESMDVTFTTEGTKVVDVNFVDIPDQEDKTETSTIVHLHVDGTGFTARSCGCYVFINKHGYDGPPFEIGMVISHETVANAKRNVYADRIQVISL